MTQTPLRSLSSLRSSFVCRVGFVQRGLHPALARRHRGYVLGREVGELDHPPAQPFGRTFVVRTEHTPMLTGAVAVATPDSLAAERKARLCRRRGGFFGHMTGLRAACPPEELQPRTH